MRRLLTLGVALSVSVFTLAVLPLAAHALSYDLTIDRCSSGCGLTNYGTVEVTQVGPVGDGTVQIAVTLAAGVTFVKTGSNGIAFAFNINGNPTLSGFTVTPVSPVLTLRSTSAGTITLPAFGDFEYAVECAGCPNGGPGAFGGPLTFKIAAAGLTPALFEELSSGSTKAFFAADIRVTASGLTGHVGAKTANNVVPEPGTLVLAGSALVGLGAWAARRGVRSRRPIA